MKTSFLLSDPLTAILRRALPAAFIALPLSVAAQTAPNVNIGVVTPLSPPGDSASGQLIVRGAELGAKFANERVGDMWNAQCDKLGNFAIVRGDDSGVPEKGLAAFRSLLSNDKVAGILGAYDSSVALAMQPLSEQAQVPMMITQASADRLSSSHADYTFQTHTLASDRSDVIEAFIKAYGFKRVAILAENTDYGTTSGPDMQKRFEKAGIESRLWIFDRANPDLLSTLLQAKKFAPDVIYNMGVGAPAYLLVKQSADVGLLPKTPMVISYDLPIQRAFWKNVGDLGKNIIFVAYYQPSQALTEAGKWMQQEYEEMYKESPMYSSFAAFGNTILLAQAMNIACSTEGKAVADALRKGPLTSWNQKDVSFPQKDGVDWQRTVQPIMVLQYTDVNQSFSNATILYPNEIKTGDIQK